MKYTALLLTVVFLCGCESLAGRPGGWGFNMFATDEQRMQAREDQGKAARMNCQSLGYTGQALYACTQKSVNQ